MRTLQDIWLTARRMTPDQLAVKDERTARTYREVTDRAFRLAGALRDAGVRKNDRVAMMAMNGAAWFDFYAACNIAGFIATTVNFRLAAREVEMILADSGAKVLIYEDQYEDLILGIRSRLPALELTLRLGGEDSYEAFLQGGKAEARIEAIDPEDIAHLIYTSGTTGRAKGVARSHRAEVANGRALALSMGMRAGGSILLMMPMFHIGALAEAHGQLFCRGAVHLHRDFNPRKILETIAGERIVCTHMAPTMVQAFLDEPAIGDYDLSSLETLCYAAAPMPVTLLRKGVELLGPIFVDCYGSSELGAATALPRCAHNLHGSEDETERLGSVGQALNHTEIAIIDDAGQILPPGTVGEVSVRSDSALSFYWNNHGASLDAIRDGWFSTGDMGFLDEQGYLFLVDRKKDMIISGGENIYCREVEEAIMDHAEVVDVAVIGVPDDYWGEAVKAVVVRASASTVSAEALIEHCATMIARYKRPKSVDFVDELPRLPSGKVNKVTLRETYAAKRPASA